MEIWPGHSRNLCGIIIRKEENHPLPNLQRFRDIFGTQGGRIYQSHGWYSHEIGQLQMLLRCLNEKRGGISDHRDYVSNYYFYVDQVLPANAIYLAAYSLVTLDGFNLTTACMNDLERLLYLYQCIEIDRNSVHHFIKSVANVAEISSQRGINDPTMLRPDLNALQGIFQGYGDVAYENICADLQNWRDTYRWKL